MLSQRKMLYFFRRSQHLHDRTDRDNHRDPYIHFKSWVSLYRPSSRQNEQFLYKIKIKTTV